ACPGVTSMSSRNARPRVPGVVSAEAYSTTAGVASTASPGAVPQAGTPLTFRRVAAERTDVPVAASSRSMKPSEPPKNAKTHGVPAQPCKAGVESGATVGGLLIVVAPKALVQDTMFGGHQLHCRPPSEFRTLMSCFPWAKYVPGDTTPGNPVSKTGAVAGVIWPDVGAAHWT